MGHHHSHHHAHEHSTKNLKVAFFLNLSFTIIEIIGGVYTNSLAILSDALHDLGDSLSLGVSWYFEKVSKKGRTPTYSYGLRRFSLMGAIINSVILIVGSVIILSHALPSLFDPEAADAEGMIVLSILGIAVNGAAVFKLSKGTSLNERVVSLHLLEDVLGWVAVLIGSIVMKLTYAPFIDPLLSILISGFILYNVFKNIKESVRIILQGTPQQVSVDVIEKKLEDMPEVQTVHACHVWSLDGAYHVLSVHAVLDDDYTLSHLADMKQHIRSMLKNESISHVTIEFEREGENCAWEDC